MKRTRRLAGLAGAALLTLLASVRAAASATGTSVFFAGGEVRWACPVKGLLGFPCPSCGMTRSVVHALDGELGAALALNPGGPLLVFGALLVGASLVALSLWPRSSDARSFDAALGRLKLGASAYGLLTLAVVLTRWAWRFV